MFSYGLSIPIVHIHTIVLYIYLNLNIRMLDLFPTSSSSYTTSTAGSYICYGCMWVNQWPEDMPLLVAGSHHILLSIDVCRFVWDAHCTVVEWASSLQCTTVTYIDNIQLYKHLCPVYMPDKGPNAWQLTQVPHCEPWQHSLRCHLVDCGFRPVKCTTFEREPTWGCQAKEQKTNGRRLHQCLFVNKCLSMTSISKTNLYTVLYFYLLSCLRLY